MSKNKTVKRGEQIFYQLLSQKQLILKQDFCIAKLQ